ncbi:hypothetical protein G7Y89_g9501 [Cudoniella acicularis]|uniref:Uncharacterized protein n=1 Tax=Cudoniella acicularis TaxID=354080 RepID=A0A8H4RG28_9HELO|nr:hypothetical protein G7Y89_g9501 [Cudoniella acicularis]
MTETSEEPASVVSQVSSPPSNVIRQNHKQSNKNRMACLTRWYDEEVRKCLQTHTEGSDMHRASIKELDSKLRLGDFSWDEMRIEKRYFIRFPTQIKIMQHMRQHNYIDKPKSSENKQHAYKLYEKIGLHAQGMDISIDFVAICRFKVDNFIVSKGRAMVRASACEIEAGGPLWAEYTRAWLRDDWDGDISAPPQSRNSKQRSEKSLPSTMVDFDKCSSIDKQHNDITLPSTLSNSNDVLDVNIPNDNTFPSTISNPDIVLDINLPYDDTFFPPTIADPESVLAIDNFIAGVIDPEAGQSVIGPFSDSATPAANTPISTATPQGRKRSHDMYSSDLEPGGLNREAKVDVTFPPTAKQSCRQTTLEHTSTQLNIGGTSPLELSPSSTPAPEQTYLQATRECMPANQTISPDLFQILLSTNLD